MLSDTARIRTALGLPMSQAEIDAFLPYAVDVFFAGMRLQGPCPKIILRRRE